jgi:ABC-type Fe3+ transport system substrate-binding protein
LCLGGCGSSSPASVRLVLISPHRDEIREEVALAFQDWLRQRYPDQTEPVEIVWQDIGGGTSQIAKYVKARFEGSPGGIGIDLLFGGGTDIFLRFAREGFLEPYTKDAPQPERIAALLKRIKPDLNGVPMYDPQGRWFGPVLSSFGILYNREVLKRIKQDEPRTWADLGKPGFRSWVSAGDPRLTGSVHMVYEIILQSHGWEEGFSLLLRLGANTHTFIRDSGTLTRTVISGDVAAAGNVDVNAFSAVGRDPERMGYYLPKGETIINPDALAVFKGAPQRKLAWAFVEFTLSDAGQKVFLLRPGEPGGPRRYPLCRLSVVEELYEEYPPAKRSVAEANPFAVKNLITYNSDLGNRRWDALNDLFGAVVVDAHPDLAAAWKEVCQLPEGEHKAKLEKDLFTPRCSLAELEAHARSIRTESPRVRTERVNRWGEEARQHYRAIRRAPRQD